MLTRPTTSGASLGTTDDWLEAIQWSAQNKDICTALPNGCVKDAQRPLSAVSAAPCTASAAWRRRHGRRRAVSLDPATAGRRSSARRQRQWRCRQAHAGSRAAPSAAPCRRRCRYARHCARRPRAPPGLTAALRRQDRRGSP
eukprot:351009-Chlamydomonas_euryale.AAC.1